jgi:endo-1,4-beta-xylanase
MKSPTDCRPFHLPGLDRRALLGSSTALAALGIGGLGTVARAQAAAGLGAAWRNAFRIGVAVSNRTLDQRIPEDLDLIAREFNAVTAENAMKWGVIRPDGINWQWERPDALVDFASANDMYILGHNLVWHSQIPASVFTDADGNRLTRAALLSKMAEHIETLVGRYRGRVHAWDVVNEGIDEGNGWRRSPWFNIIGDDYMEQAFRLAHAADGDATLLYNDYNMHNPEKRAFLVDVLRDYLDRGVPIHGVGLQSHVGLDYPDLDEWEQSIATYADMGLEVHITELDVDVLPSPYAQSADVANRFQSSEESDPWPNGLPAEVQERLADRYEQLFRILLGYRDRVERVTMWGLYDGISWKNNFPINGRTNYPLLFGRDRERKPAYYRLLELARNEL